MIKKYAFIKLIKRCVNKKIEFKMKKNKIFLLI